MTIELPALSRSAIDRAAQHRLDEGWLRQAWADPATRVLVVADGQALVRHRDAGPTLRFVASPAAPAGERYFLGLDADHSAYFAVAADTLPSDDDAAPAGLREVGAVLDDRDAGLLVHAIALANWHATHTHCPRCGERTEPVAAGHIRRCVADGSEHFPRTDPAVIMAVVGPDERVLLGHQASWPDGRFSTLAGFVEPGESLEQAVRREVLEEAGIVVSNVHYLGSQPWPFPSSLMVGFVAHTEGTVAVADGEELSEARWFSRAALADAVRTGEVRLPPRVSIARRLIEHWYGGPLEAEDSWR